MTRKQWSELTPDQQRVKIAELCGWTNCHLCTLQEFNEGGSDLDGMLDSPVGYKPGEKYVSPIPRFTDDLNAMHETFMYLLNLDVIPAYYWENLGKILNWKGEGRDTRLWSCVVHTATAAQRAEALVLTMTPSGT